PERSEKGIACWLIMWRSPIQARVEGPDVFGPGIYSRKFLAVGISHKRQPCSCMRVVKTREEVVRAAFTLLHPSDASPQDGTGGPCIDMCSQSRPCTDRSRIGVHRNALSLGS